MTDDFTNYPVSISERRAEQEHDASKWTPRDILINLLREIDRGNISPDALVCVYRFTDEDGGKCARYAQSSSDVDAALGLLTRGQRMIMGGCEG